MSNIWHNGEENASNTAGHEWDTLTGTGGSNTATAHGGGAYGQRAWRAQHGVAGITHQTHQFGATGNNGNEWYPFCAFKWDTLPGAECIFFQIHGAVVAIHDIKLTTTGVIRIYRNDTGVQIGSDGPTLSTGVWYWGGLSYNATTGLLQLYLAQEGQSLVVVASGTTITTQSSVRIRRGIITSTTGDVSFDDCVINNSAGTVNNVIPQETYMTALRPNADGDNNNASAGTFADIDEVTPDEATTLLILDANGDIIDVNIGAVTTPPTRQQHLVPFVGVWSRSRANSAASESWRRRIKSQASGTLLEDAADITHNDTTFKTNGDNVPLLPLVADTDPQTTGLRWTFERVTDAVQIGQRAVDATPDIEITQMLLYVAWTLGPVMVNQAVVESPSSLGLVSGPLVRTF